LRAAVGGGVSGVGAGGDSYAEDSMEGVQLEVVHLLSYEPHIAGKYRGG